MNLNKPIITVIVPVYNVQKYLNKCIKSIINQSYKYLQIILVDDGSTDKSSEICDYYAKIDNRIEVIHKSNEGLSMARNVALNKAKGRYIGFVDSDDYIEETMYKDLLDAIIKYDTDVSICNFYSVIDGKKNVKNDVSVTKLYDKIEILKEILLDNCIQSYAWNKLYKRELFKTVKYPIGRKYEDIGTTFYILEQCSKVVAIGKPEYYYINRKDSIVNTLTEKTIIDYLEIIIDRFKYIEKNIPQLTEYNNYYLMKIVNTSYKDVKKLKNRSIKLDKTLRNLYKIVKKIGIDKFNSIKNLYTEKEFNEIIEVLNILKI